MAAAVPKFENQWVQAPLPPARRAYGINVNYGVLGGKDKITYGNGHLAIIRDVENPADCVVFAEHKANVNVVVPSPSGYWVASGDDTGVVNVWSYPQLTLKNTLRIGTSISDIRWTADSKRIVAAGAGTQECAKAFNWDSQNNLGKIDRITKTVLSVDWSPIMPHRVATADEDMTVNFYHGVPFKYDSRTLKHTRYPNVLRYAPDGSVFATVGSDSKIFLYDGKTGEVVRELIDETNGHTGSIFGLAWAPTSKQLVTASADKTVKVWDLDSGKVEHTWGVDANTGEFDDQQASVMWSASDKIVSVSISGVLNFWTRDSATPKVIYGHKSLILSYALHRESNKLYTVDGDNRVTVWNATDGTSTWLTGTGAHKNKGIDSVAVSADGLAVYTGGRDNSIYRNTPTEFGVPVVSAPGLIPYIATANTSNDRFAFVSNRKVFLVVGDKITSEVALKDAGQLVFAPQDNEIYVCGITAKVLFTLKIDGDQLVAAGQSADEFQSSVTCVAVSDKFVVSNQHNEINVWNEDRSGSKSFGWCYHNSGISSMKWSPSQQYLATAGTDNQLIVWRDFTTFKPKPVVITDVIARGITWFDWVDDNTIIVIGVANVIKKISITAQLPL